MTRDELIARALAFPGAVESYPFGEDLLTVKVGSRVFAWIPLADGWLGQGPRLAVKLPADLVAELYDAYPDDVHAAGPLDRRYWVAVHLGSTLADSEVAELLAVSYREVVTRLPRSRRPPVQ